MAQIIKDRGSSQPPDPAPNLVQTRQCILAPKANGRGYGPASLFLEGCAVFGRSPTERVQDGVIKVSDQYLTHAENLSRYRYQRNHPGRIQGSAIRPPVIGCGAPVVPGNEIGRPRTQRAAR